MDTLRELAQQRGYFLRREALRLGFDDRHLHRGVSAGRLVRIRQGAYAPADLWRAMTEQHRYLARSLASYDLAVEPVALSHLSALAAYGCPLWSVSFADVHLTYLVDGTTRRESGRARHALGRLERGDFVVRGERTIATPAWATIGGMTRMSSESGLVAADWMIREGLTTAEELWALKQRVNRHPGTLPLEVTLRLADGGCASVGESRGKHLFFRMGVPAPLYQYAIRASDGTLVGICDFAWPEHGVYGEFDGRVKYGRLLKPGQDPGEVVFDEKRREDAIRRVTGGTVVRWTWSDLHPQSAPSRQLVGLLRGVA